VAYVLWGVGGAVGITALALALTGSDDRDALSSMESLCDAGDPACDTNQLYQLSNDVNNRKTTVAVLTGGAIVSVAIATILFFTAHDEPTRTLTREPTSDAGVPVFSFTGTGGSVRINF
jgi:hypothetical protein